VRRATIDRGRPEIHMTINFEWMLGLLMVLTYAIGRFNTPNTNRSSTTVARFWFALLSYCIGVVFLYLLLSGVVTNSPEIVQALGIGGQGIPQDLPKASGPLLAALILTVLLPNFPVICRIDQGLLKFFQDMGNIPLEVRLLSAQLRKADIEIPAAVQKDAQSYVKNKLESAGLKAEYLCFTKCDTPQYDWTRIVSMMTVLRSWEGRRRYAAMLSEFAEDYKQVNDKFERLNVSAARCFPMFLAGAPAGKKSAAGAGLPNPIAECRRAFQEQCEDLFNDIANLVARGILKCEFTRRERDARLAEVGFADLDAAVGGVDPNKIVAAVAMVFVILVTGIVLASKLFNETPFDIRRALTMSVMVAIIYGGAIVCALLPKSTWGFANRGKVGGRPLCRICGQRASHLRHGGGGERRLQVHHLHGLPQRRPGSAVDLPVVRLVRRRGGRSGLSGRRLSVFRSSGAGLGAVGGRRGDRLDPDGDQHGRVRVALGDRNRSELSEESAPACTPRHHAGNGGDRLRARRDDSALVQVEHGQEGR
jgi:hypothetical protein